MSVGDRAASRFDRGETDGYPTGLTLLSGAIAAVVLSPIVWIVMRVLQVDTDYALSIVARPMTVEILLTSLGLVAAVTGASICIGVPLAFLPSARISRSGGSGPSPSPCRWSSRVIFQAFTFISAFGPGGQSSQTHSRPSASSRFHRSTGSGARRSCSRCTPIRTCSSRLGRRCCLSTSNSSSRTDARDDTLASIQARNASTTPARDCIGVSPGRAVHALGFRYSVAYAIGRIHPRHLRRVQRVRSRDSRHALLAVAGDHRSDPLNRVAHR